MWANICQKIPVLAILGAVSPYVLSYKGKIWHEGADLGHSQAKFGKNRLKGCHSWKCGLTAPKIAKIGNFWYKFAQKAT